MTWKQINKIMLLISFGIICYLYGVFGFFLSVCDIAFKWEVLLVIVVLLLFYLLFHFLIREHLFLATPNKRIRGYYRIAASVGCLSVLLLMIAIGDWKESIHFTSKKWRERVDQRVFIVDNLLHHYRLKGKSKAEVIQLLGKPTETEYFKQSNNIVYYLGDERGYISIDSEWLVVTFGNNREDKVSKVEIVTD
ncbi:hypothetical protein [Shimazuella kribbensis]|uniref:hypothetical protein n=1 Tax=Shimazuella kribbensis TaxID=139808 RepID=UPI00041E8A46|nr:hypothetical protein [Shimazuella kribbensis]